MHIVDRFFQFIDIKVVSIDSGVKTPKTAVNGIGSHINGSLKDLEVARGSQ